ncbi:D-Ala-D-Ala carboxypeptidase family metallohydrolase [Aquabacterium sp. OR-4]|uniref:D-Ala-D-Ala carboxypeptidase family metallohydrolase n=1 Tax=Aquabacterium sp. OR-4 TaxID=2978127 RepID=UPI0021B389AE|nr:D-Ala-D-Ala carboxypeptidase family metallohydrolase [Aquabacterium sp. OR-4]MDT7834947.1 D-Ala-D-Ala carboxypeptidase family metallohydrolase [Aquabacterium sp. OR-4]
MHFSLDEFTASTTAARRGIPNVLPLELLPAAHETLAMLQRIRDWLSAQAGRDVPVVITSGYRCGALNAAVGSSPRSDHVRAMAADWRAPAFGTSVEVCRALAPMVGALGIGQLINEFPGPSGWVHASTAYPLQPVNRVITITSAGTVPGIIGA